MRLSVLLPSASLWWPPSSPTPRQDKKHLGREPISARLVADLYATAGAERLMSVDLHSAQEQGFFDGPWDHLWAQPVLVDYVSKHIDPANTTVVSPDAGRIRVAERWADKLGGTRWHSFTRPVT